MDILEKARAFDEALERARKELNACGSTDCDAARQIIRLFPELAESKDEKIRKAIISVLEQNIRAGFDHSDGFKFTEMITWLEKQKDIDSKEYVFRPLAGCLIDSAAIQAVEQQKLGKKIVLAFNGAYIPVEEKTAVDIVNEYYSWLKKQGSISKCWTEEDEDMAGRIRDALKGTRYNYYYQDSIEMIDWLESLKQRLEGK